MIDAQLAAAIQALVTTIVLLQPSPPRTAIFDPLLMIRLLIFPRGWDQKHTDASTPLDEEWSEAVATFHSFIVALYLRALEAK